MSSSARYFVNRYPDGCGKEIPNNSITRKSAEDIVTSVLNHRKFSLGECDGGLYVGLGGVAYMLYHCGMNPYFQDLKQKYLTIAKDAVELQLSYDCTIRDKITDGSFLLGKVGTHAIAAAIYHSLGDTANSGSNLSQFVKYCSACQSVNYLKCGSDELFVGRAGVLCGAYWLQQQLKQQILPFPLIQKICDAILESGTKYATQHRSLSPLMYSYYETEYLGAAHGLSSILQALLYFPMCWENDARKRQLIQSSIDFLLSVQQPNGNFPCAMDEVGNHRRLQSQELVHWCHGAPGTIYLMAKAFLYFKDEKYLHSCIKCAEIVWEKGLLKKGPGICHGVAGSGYVFLLLYRLTQNPLYLHRSHKFADFLSSEEFNKSARIPDSPYSLYEGLAGTACFVADLTTPETSYFPFFDIF